MEKIEINVAESILNYIDDGRFMSPSLISFHDILDSHIIKKEKVFIDLIPYFCSYIDIVKRISEEYKDFFLGNLFYFYESSISQSSIEVFKFLLNNFNFIPKKTELRKFLIISTYNYLNYSYKDSLFILNWCFEQCILNDIEINFCNDDFKDLNLYKKNNKFNKEISFIENKLNISNF